MAMEGSCHCGAYGFTAEGAPEMILECNCSHCARKGFLLWFAAPDQVRIKGDESAMTLYKFNTHNISHLFCPTCGVQPFGRGIGPDGKEMIAINLRCAPDFDRSGFTTQHFDGQKL